MQLVEEKKEAERAARAKGQLNPPVQREAHPADRMTIEFRTKAANEVPETSTGASSPLLHSPKMPHELRPRNTRSRSVYSNYSDDGTHSSPRRSPVFGKSRAGKAFDFGKPATHSDDEEDIVETVAYRTQCTRKLVEAEIPSLELKVGRRISMSTTNSPSSPLSPQLKGVNRRSSCIAALPALQASSETIGTDLFQPSPLPGQIHRSAPEIPAARTNSDSFLTLVQRPNTAHAGLPKESLHAAVGQFDSPVEKVSKTVAPESRSDWLRNYKCSMRKCVSPITEGWKRPDGGAQPSGRMMAIFDTGFYVVGDCSQCLVAFCVH